jgi:hypothetical protein
VIFEHSVAVGDQQRARANRRRHIVKPLEINTVVMIVDQNKKNKMEPTFVGPYTIVKRTRGKTYHLVDSTGALLDRKVPIDQLRVVSLPPEQLAAAQGGARVDGKSFTVEKILRHRLTKSGETEFRVKWKGFDSSHDSWEPQSNFDDLGVITSYWSGSPVLEK